MASTDVAVTTSTTTGPVFGGAVLLMAVYAGCSSGADDDPETVFEKKAAPVIEARCTASACHGVRSSRIDRVRDRLPAGSLSFEVDENRKLVAPEAARQMARKKINTVERPEFSSLLREPLSPDWGGLPHEGGTNFSSTRDPGYRAMRTWIQTESEGGEDPEGTLTDRQQFFADKVQPRLIGRNCAATNCHGPSAFIPFRLDPGIPADDGSPAFSRATTRKNYREARGFLSLEGPPQQSRLLRKGLPLRNGGIPHRGGNSNFFTGPDDPAVRAVVKWAKKERKAEPNTPDVETEPGLLWVRGPVESRSPFEVGQFVPGRDLHLRKTISSEESTNLTADLHDQPADVRDPDVAPNGRKVAFSMRRGRDEGFQIWEMDLETREAQPLTSPPARLDSGRPTVDVTPVYGPDGWVYFASNRHDVRAERGETLDLDLFRVPTDGGDVERLTFTPSHEIEPTILNVAPRSGYLLFSYRRSIDDRDQTIGFSFPLDFHRDYHIFFGRTATPDLLYQFTELPDGRTAAIAGDPSNRWAGGRLALVDRDMGPDLRAEHDREAASVPAYADTYHPLDPDTAATGESSGGLYREPTALPDGSLLVAHSPKTADLDRSDTSVDYRIERITLDEAPDDCLGVDCEPKIDSRTTLVSADETDVFDPEPVHRWPGRGKTESVLDPSEPARYSISAPAVNNGISTDLSPIGPKKFRDDIEALRFIEALPQSPEVSKPGISSPPGPHDVATDATAGLHMPARILGEVPLEEDGSVSVTLPPNTPFRTQYLDEDGMVVGRQHNRWLYVWPGQHFRQATRPDLYDQRCGGCHGARSGQPTDAWQTPDATSRASLTLARYRDRNPAKPREPTKLGEKTRRTVDFRNDIQPIVERHCGDADCHAADSGAGGLVLAGQTDGPYSTGYVNLMAEGDGSGGGYAYVDETHARARTSHLVEILRGEELEAPKSIDGHPDLDLEKEEVQTVVRWIEVGAPWEVSP